MTVSTEPAYATGDIVQSRATGEFFRVVSDGVVTSVSVPGPRIPADAVTDPVVLVHADGTPTGHAGVLETRVAAMMARRYR